MRVEASRIYLQALIPTTAMSPMARLCRSTTKLQRMEGMCHGEAWGGHLSGGRMSISAVRPLAPKIMH